MEITPSERVGLAAGLPLTMFGLGDGTAQPTATGPQATAEEVAAQAAWAAAAAEAQAEEEVPAVEARTVAEARKAERSRVAERAEERGTTRRLGANPAEHDERDLDPASRLQERRPLKLSACGQSRVRLRVRFRVRRSYFRGRWRG